MSAAHMNSAEPPIAKVRNKLSPMVTYFSFRKMLDNGEVDEDKRDYLQKLVDECYNLIQNGNMEALLLLIKDDKLWA
jgi:hypothetical protein